MARKTKSEEDLSKKYVLTADGLQDEDSEDRVMRNLDTAWNHVRQIEAFLLEQ